MSALLSAYKWPLVGVATGLVLMAAAALYAKGRADGAAVAASNARAELIEQLTSRSKIDASVESMPAADLCRELGGLWRDGICE